MFKIPDKQTKTIKKCIHMGCEQCQLFDASVKFLLLCESINASVRLVSSFSLRLTSTATKKLKNYYCSSRIQATGQHHLVCSSSLTDGPYPFRCSKPFPSAEKAILIESDNSFACCDEMQQLAFCGSSSSAIHCALISVHIYLTNHHRIALLNSLFTKSSVDTTCL